MVSPLPFPQISMNKLTLNEPAKIMSPKIIRFSTGENTDFFSEFYEIFIY